MTCHNGSLENDFAGPGLENPHPFEGAGNLRCTGCHGGNGEGEDRESSHIPNPPEIGDDANLIANRQAYFNRLTLTGIDKFDDYTVNGVTYTALDYLQFINPGDLRVVSLGRSCGKCHEGHVNRVENSLLATASGIFSGATYAIGVDNAVTENQGLFEDTAADKGFRDALQPGFVVDPFDVGGVGRLIEFPVFSVLNDPAPNAIHKNDNYDSDDLPLDQLADGRVITGSNLANLYHEQIAFTCGDCHLGSAGANNRFGDFRSSGCTACHMPYSLDGRSTSSDPNVNKFEPADPDDIEAPERSHVKQHKIISVARTDPGGEFVPGIDDYACAGCHQGSNRTVMQYWGIRLDQNQDVRRGNQYPANPVSYQTTSGDTRLFDPVAGNNTFNGRNRNQYLLFEDYDGDLRDDTPPDVHYEAGMGCIDCHGSFDLHGGDVNDPNGEIYSRMEQGVAIQCESCHGSAEAYASVATGTSSSGESVQLVQDRKGNLLDHVERRPNGDYILTSRLTGVEHYVPQTRDTVVDSGKTHPGSGDPIYSAMASFAMGRADGISSTGIGPQQSGAPSTGFSHGDSMSCVSCHAAWTNNCVGCHLSGEYDTNNNFSNITGDRIAYEEDNADFVYQNPLLFQLGVNAHNKIAPIAANTETFYQYEDKNHTESKIFAFSDRQGLGNNQVTTAVPSLSHNTLMPHSIRGRVTSSNEGPRYCVACHLTDESLANFGAEYDALRTALSTSDFASLDFDLLQEHIGMNPGNQMNSPLWVHMVAGLGSGLFLFDENGGAVNPLDENDDRVGSGGTSPKDQFNINNVVFDLDRIVTEDGTSTGSNNHVMLDLPGAASLRAGENNPNFSGPLPGSTIMRLTDPSAGIVLDSWIDANGVVQGDAGTFVVDP